MLRKIKNSLSHNKLDTLVEIAVGGVDQWLHIRGQKENNPLLLFLHGGPGAPHIGWFDKIQRPWEEHFTVVQWDQRQTGKSYFSMSDLGHTMTNDQLIRDTESVIDYLRDTFSTDKIFLMGTSYGTYLGMHMVKRRPEWLYAYIGVGQITHMLMHTANEYRLLLDHARSVKDQPLIDQLEAMAPYPNPQDKTGSFFNNILFLLDAESRLGKCYPLTIKQMIVMIRRRQWVSPLYNWRDLWHSYFGDAPATSYRGYPFGDEFVHIDIPKELGYHFDVPIFLFSGKDDWHISPATTQGWFDALETPYKEQVWFNHSAHVPYMTEPDAFLSALVEKVLPLMAGEYIQ